MLRRMLVLTCLLVLFAGVEVAPPAEAAPPPGDIPVVEIDGLPALPVHEATVGLRAQGVTPASDARTSAPTRTPITFSMVGFELADPATEVAFRTSVDGLTWSAWSHAHTHEDEGPDAGAAVEGVAVGGHHTEPVWVGDARHLQLRVDRGATEEVGIALVDATGANRSLGARTADAFRAAFRVTGDAAFADEKDRDEEDRDEKGERDGLDAPGIVSREEWGADESRRRRDPNYADDVDFGVLHHTAGTNDYDEDEAAAVVRGIYAYHTESRGWNDIGYHFLVDRFGTVYEGRYGGIDEPVIGAHAGGFNIGSFGVALIGDYTGSAPESAQLEALRKLLAWKYARHDIDPSDSEVRTSGGSTRYSAGTTVRLENLSGHRDVSLTSCPGGAYDLLDSLRDDVAEQSERLRDDARDAASPIRSG